MDVYYTREGGIPETEVARLIGARSRDEKAALKAVLAEYFQLIDGHHCQVRCDREIARYQDKQAKAKRSAEARWNTSERNANASSEHDPSKMRTHPPSISSTDADGMPRARLSQSPVTSNQTPNPEPPESVVVNSDPEPPPKAEIHSLGKFRMRQSWEPNADALEFVCVASGVARDLITKPVIAEFVTYWSDEQAVNTERQWCQKLLQAAQRAASRRTPPTETRSALEILRAGLADMDQDHDQTA
jgi:uncharacterized protein YdaU (DUF1376 family)